MIVRELIVFKKYIKARTLRTGSVFQQSPIALPKDRKHESLTAPYILHYSNGVGLSSSPVTSLLSEKPCVKRSQDGEEETLIQHVFFLHWKGTDTGDTCFETRRKDLPEKLLH
uniref:Uncharacterized protein n=1 Tax=Aotus nancymaae TaxID=37293 RepID=A0A2K5EZ09_AOTNA